VQAGDAVTDVSFSVETPVSNSVRAQQVSAMFDVPPAEKCRLEWHLKMGHDDKPWGVGLIVGPSGSGKSTLMRKLWGDSPSLKWGAPSVIDDFSKALPIAQISDACSAVGFNTIPAWLRPFHVLSNGERFRVEMARLLLEAPDDVVVVDEFTSLVDRQVAKVASHAVQKYARKGTKRFVAVTCHYDVEDWLQPDWVVDMADSSFRWRELQRRPSIDCRVSRVAYREWRVFAPFHYLTAELNPGARCFELSADGQRAAFAGVLHFPHPKVRDIRACSRLVTLPDWQGLGLAFALIDRVGAAHKAMGLRLRTYPAHPTFVRAFAKSKAWAMKRRPEVSGRTVISGGKSTLNDGVVGHNFGERPCAVFEYVGPAMDQVEARRLLQ
jgi:GNAT superfamily N-acetyltransferase